MESNRKRKLREKGFSPDTLAHFKDLRRKQKKRRRNRKKGKQPELDGMSIVQPPPTNSPSSVKRKRVGEDQYLPRGKRMVSASQKQKKNDTGVDAVAAEVQQHLRPTSHPRRRIQTPAATKECAPKKPIVRSPESSATSSTYLKNINAANLTRKAGARSIGSGTFGTCYLGKYRGIRVVIKEYKERTTKHKDSLSLLQKEARHEANVLMKLGDHPGIPLLFGVCLKEKPISIVIKFHGDGKESVTLYKAAKTKIISEKHEWQAILCETSEALNHVHRCGYAHNDLKADNIVLDRREDERLHPVIIDFGKSVAFSEAKNPPPKSEHLKSLYKDSYIAPELVNGTGKPSATSDVYSLAFLVKKIYGILNFSNIAVIKRALENSPDDRPTIKDIKAALTADC